jgi:hypothetical protein
MRLVGMDGRVYEYPLVAESGVGVADIAPQERGIYVVEVLRDGEVLTRGRVIKE